MSGSQENKKLVRKERKILAHNLKRARIDAGLTQEDMAKRTGLTQPFISGVESGTTTISLDNASRLAEAVGQPLYKLLSPL